MLARDDHILQPLDRTLCRPDFLTVHQFHLLYTTYGGCPDNRHQLMDFIISFLTQYGYWGMLMAAFLAGSFFPFSSEAVLVGLMATGLDPWVLMIYGTIGNVLGSMFNYGVGRMGKLEWIEKYLHVKEKDLAKAQRFMAGRGAWMGFFAFLPVLGSAIAIALGLMRANVIITFIAVTAGKIFRYIILIYSAGLFM
jgi:membrane protein YqaA with SNARE-associated domain